MPTTECASITAAVEPLEQRTLFAAVLAEADPNLVPIGDGATTRTVRYTEADGTRVKIRLRGPGGANVRFENADQQTATGKRPIVVSGTDLRLIGIDATGTTTATKLSVVARGGDDQSVTVTDVTADGPLAKFGGNRVSFTGGLVVNGALGLLVASDLSTATVTAGACRVIRIAGNAQNSTISLTAPPAGSSLSLTKMTVGGLVHLSRVAAAGSIGTIDVGSLSKSQIFSAVANPGNPAIDLVERQPGGSIGKVTTGHYHGSLIAADAIGPLDLGLIQTDNLGLRMGVTGGSLGGIKAINELDHRLDLPPTDDQAVVDSTIAEQNFFGRDFIIKLV